MKNIYSILLLSTSFLVFSIGYAAPLFQAGDILTSVASQPISKESGIASYFLDIKGKQVDDKVRLEFTCELHGSADNNGKDTSTALLTTGKNFANQFNSPFIVLEAGVSQPITWTWVKQEADEDSGNIKVRYLSGSNVTVLCKGKLLN